MHLIGLPSVEAWGSSLCATFPARSTTIGPTYCSTKRLNSAGVAISARLCLARSNTARMAIAIPTDVADGARVEAAAVAVEGGK